MNDNDYYEPFCDGADEDDEGLTRGVRDSAAFVLIALGCGILFFGLKFLFF